MSKNTSTDYYATLGVEPQASASAIKSAFKKLALQYHPDVYKGEDAQQRMRDLLQAYQVLSNPEKRRAYDVLQSGGITQVDVADGFVPRKGKPDGQGRFAFPTLNAEMAAAIFFMLDKVQYELSAAQGEHLWWDGLLRGSMTPVDTSCFCHRCQHRWSLPARNAALPLACPACHARDWSDYLLLRCTHCQAVFESKELRDLLRGNVFYQPYELFPLCPHCRRSHWCPAENRRVSSLRAAAARRAALFWGICIGVGVLLIVLVVFIALR